MEFLRKIGALIKSFYDKIILALLLAALAGVLLSQTIVMNGIQEEIAEIKEPKNPPTGPVEELDTAQFDIVLQVPKSRYWQPGPKVVLAENYQIETLSLSLRKFLRDQGEGSLLDPLVYVYSSHDRSSIVHYTTKVNPATSKPENRSGKATIVPGDDDDDDDDTPTSTGTPFIEYTRYLKSVQQPFPVMLRRITANDPNDKSTWLLQIDVWDKQGEKRSQFKRLGDSLEVEGYTDGFRIADVEYEVVKGNQGISRERSSVVLVDQATQERLTLNRNERIPIGTMEYELVLMPPVEMRQKARKITTEQDIVFSITLPGDGNGLETEYYKIVQAGENSLQAVRTNRSGQETNDTQFTINRFDPRAFREWKEKLEMQIRAGSRMPTPEMEPGMPPY